VNLRGILSDIRSFLLHRPTIPTLLESASEEERLDYTHRIMQRLGTSVTKYAILNIHQIGIEAPARYVFEELLKWDRETICWPNHLATFERVNGRLEHVRVFLFGQKERILGLKNGFLGLNFIPLFELSALQFQRVPIPSNSDNARYLLYECTGGYPMGIFSVYVRSSIADRGEVEQTQVFFVVGFNFYGKEDWPDTHVINRVWEKVHNRVTANIMNKFKELCEKKFQGLLDGSRSFEEMAARRTFVEPTVTR
jgi:hypothetical protein